MNVLVTGGTGFLGRQIVAALEAAGHQVVAPRSSECNLETLEGADRAMQSAIDRVGRIDALVHSAAYYGGIGIIQAEPATVFAKNTRMCVNVFELARRFNIPKVIPIGSACAYPGYIDGDLREDRFWSGPLHESVEAYGFSKKLALVAQHAFFKQHKIASNHLVLTNLYGPHDVFTEYRSHVLSALIKKFAEAEDRVVLWGDGTPVREFLFVKDAAQAVVQALPLEHDPEPINVGTGVGTSIKALAEMIAAHVGFGGTIEWDTTKPNGAARKVLDITRMREKLQWYPGWPLDRGLKETIDWYLANKEAADQRQ